MNCIVNQSRVIKYKDNENNSQSLCHICRQRLLGKLTHSKPMLKKTQGSSKICIK